VTMVNTTYEVNQHNKWVIWKPDTGRLILRIVVVNDKVKSLCLTN
jgi:hypothetical protein